VASRHAARLARRATGVCIDRFHPFNSRSITDADSNILCARTSFTADEIDTIYNDLWAAGYVLHCTDIEDGEVVVPRSTGCARLATCCTTSATGC
jgi:hypothetical protein